MGTSIFKFPDYFLVFFLKSSKIILGASLETILYAESFLSCYKWLSVAFFKKFCDTLHCIAGLLYCPADGGST